MTPSWPVGVDAWPKPDDVLNERWPSVCVVIPNHDRVNELLQAVASVEAQHYEGQVRIYIVYLERPGIDGVLSRLENVIALPSTNEEGRNSLAVKRNIAIDASTEDLVVVYREVVDAACGWAVYGGVVSVMVVSM